MVFTNPHRYNVVPPLSETWGNDSMEHQITESHDLELDRALANAIRCLIAEALDPDLDREPAGA